MMFLKSIRRFAYSFIVLLWATALLVVMDCTQLQAEMPPVPLAPPQGDTAIPAFLTDNQPQLDPLAGVIDNVKVYLAFLNRGTQLIKQPGIMTVKKLDEALKVAPRQSDVELPIFEDQRGADLYESMVESTLMIGVLYDCGRCNNLHANIACGVAVSADGLVLTNYHVVSRNDEGVKGILAMTSDGRAFPIVEVLGASKKADIALVRIANDQPLAYARIASNSPRPLEKIRILSHPQNEFFVVTEGVVSRISKPTMSNDKATWLEVTAQFAAGSSGAGVFNESGDLVGIVSRVYPLMRNMDEDKRRDPAPRDGRGSAYAEMVLRRCVPHSEIIECFKESQK